MDTISTKMLRMVFAGITQHSDGLRRSPKTILVSALYFFCLVNECTSSSGRCGSVPGESYVPQDPQRCLLPLTHKLHPTEVPAHALPVSTNIFFFWCNANFLFCSKMTLWRPLTPQKNKQKKENEKGECQSQTACLQLAAPELPS